MIRQTQLQAVFVEFIPERLELGRLYISQKYSTAIHLCCCGCGNEVVTPLNPARWQLTEHKGKVSLSPSIGNWNFPCRSHYWIVDGQVRWASALSPSQIAAVRKRDLRDAELYAQATSGFGSIRQRAKAFWRSLINLLRQILRL
jgi:hypothetical protein